MIPDPWSQHEIDVLLERGDVDDLTLIPIAITNLGTPDPAWSEAICLRLASHAAAAVRGNAVLGLGHLARVARKLDSERCLPVIRLALQDPDPYVRGQATSAPDDVRFFLGWRVLQDRSR
jgi:hypothetical protein